MQGKEFNKLLLSKELWLIFMPFVTVPSFYSRSQMDVRAEYGFGGLGC